MDKKNLQKLIDKKMSTREIAQELSIGQSTVRYWLDKHEIKTKINPKNKGGRNCGRKCKCGETDLSKFYGHKYSLCGSCHNEYTKKKGKEKREYAVKKLGSKCKHCGWDEFSCGLDIHHLDPKEKDPKFSSMRGWSYKRIDKELEKCILLCKNHHAALHNGDIDVPK